MKNYGIINEYRFVEFINNKTLRELTFLLQELILFLFPHIKENTIIKYFNYYVQNTNVLKPLNGVLSVQLHIALLTTQLSYDSIALQMCIIKGVLYYEYPQSDPLLLVWWW